MAAFIVGFVITGNQHDGMEVPVGEHSRARNLSTLIDSLAACHYQVRAGRYKGIQVDHGTTGLPKEPVKLSLIAVKSCTHDLTPCIDGVRDTARVIVDRAEISHHTIPPEKRVRCLIACSCGNAHNISGLIQRIPKANTPAKCAQVFEGFAVPKKGVEGQISGQVRGAGHLTPVVELGWPSAGAAKSPEIHHRAVLP
jgi:hypothetical protein